MKIEFEDGNWKAGDPDTQDRREIAHVGDSTIEIRGACRQPIKGRYSDRDFPYGNVDLVVNGLRVRLSHDEFRALDQLILHWKSEIKKDEILKQNGVKA